MRQVTIRDIEKVLSSMASAVQWQRVKKFANDHYNDARFVFITGTSEWNDEGYEWEYIISVFDSRNRALDVVIEYDSHSALRTMGFTVHTEDTWDNTSADTDEYEVMFDLNVEPTLPDFYVED